MDNTLKAALLLNAINASSTIFARLCNEHDPQDLWQSQSLWQELRLTDRMQQRLSGFLRDDWAEREYDRVQKFGARFIPFNSIDYPPKLYDLKKPPIGLYVKGNVNISLPLVSIVGTRKCSVYAEGVATNLGKALAQNGIITLSGGAKGIDTAGHQGTLAENGVTVVIFGTGLDKVYPVENKDLFERIIERGAWVSEYPFGTDGNPWRFPERDRIIAGMSAHIVVAESPEGGGAMHTARIGIELGRDVWSIPGRITDDVSRGTNLLVREGTNIFLGISDFIKIITGHEQINIAFMDSASDSEAANTTTPPELSDDAKTVYSLIQRYGGRTADELLTDSGLDFMAVQSAIMDISTIYEITDAREVFCVRVVSCSMR